VLLDCSSVHASELPQNALPSVNQRSEDLNTRLGTAAVSDPTALKFFIDRGLQVKDRCCCCGIIPPSMMMANISNS